MTDDRLRRALEAAEGPLAPDPQFAAALRDELRQELGFIPAVGVRRYPLRGGTGAAGTRRSSLRVLLVAAVITAGALATAAVAGSLLNRSIHQNASLLDQVEATGRIRIAIRPDHPQFKVPGQTAAGFDADVARALADHLGVRGDIVLIDAPAILSGQEDERWDIALPSVASWQIDTSRFFLSQPYYRWVHRLVVAETSTVASAADLANAPVCAVAGDDGEAWLRGRYAGAAGSAVTTQVVSRASDEDCFAALASGQVMAAVTARLSDADLQVRSGIRVIDGPDPEPRAVVVRRVEYGAEDMVSAIDAALGQMRNDATLTRLSQNRFGGADLSQP
jgi:ABC-type amino acid transport substrate-binding protein